MPYTLFDPSKPDASNQNGTQIMQSIQLNMKALRDMIAAGTLVYWNATISGGTADKPTQILHNKGDEYIKEVIVWGTTGGATDNPSTITYSYSAVAGGAGAYDTIGKITYSYDASGNVTSWAWSAS